MLLSFNLSKYSFVFGIRKRKDRSTSIEGKMPDSIAFEEEAPIPIESEYTTQIKARHKSAPSFTRPVSTTFQGAGYVNKHYGNSGTIEKDVQPLSQADLFQITGIAREIISESIRVAGNRLISKDELLKRIATLLKPYRELADSSAHPFRIAINNVIQMEALKHCTFDLSTEELRLIWRQVR